MWLARDIRYDSWFILNWMFHEKPCAQSLQFLLPLPPYHRLSPSHHRLIEDDLFFNLNELQEDAPVTLSAEFRGVYSSNDGREVTIAGRLNERLSGNPTQDWWTFGKIGAVFKRLEWCDNGILSDRLAILENVCPLPMRLQSKSTTLDEVSRVFASHMMDRTIGQMVDYAHKDCSERLAYAVEKITADAVSSLRKTLSK
jgi:hypothetical protein